MGFLDAVAGPLADLLRAVADWLDQDVDGPDPVPEVEQSAKWVPNDRGGFDPA